jgi:type III restriction enzyme
MFNPLQFQNDAVEELLDKFTKLWKREQRELPLVFKSPTGSGKTFMVANFIVSLNHLPNWDGDKAFVWITFSDDLAMQSKEKFEEYFENNIENKLLTVADFNRGKLQKNDILFINWQKVVSKAAENRKLRRPDSEDDRKERGLYFEDVIDNTHNENREIILVIDEAHTHVTKELAQQIIDYINPKIIVHVTATPPESIELESRRLNSFVEVDRNRVVDEGLIKEKIVVQTEEELKKYNGEDADQVLINLGIEKRNELVKEYKKLGKNINPLVLIQLPNDDRQLIEIGQKTKESVVLDLLVKRGIDEKLIAAWFDGKQKNMDGITDNESEIQFMLFKQAAGTGWDCPRAHILIMFREITADVFYIQTVGRILRMPEPNKKDDYKNSTLIRTGFLFTNYDRNKVISEWDAISPNKPEVYVAVRNKGIKNIKLKSDFISRLDYGDLSNSVVFQKSFIESMNRYFDFPEGVLPDIKAKKLIERGIELKPKITNSIVVDAKFTDFDQLEYEFKREGHGLSLEMSRNDVEKTFTYYCYKLLKEQDDEAAKISNVARSWGPLKSGLRVWFKGILGDESNYYYKVFIFDIDKGASSKFRPAITNALKEYKPKLEKILEERRRIEETKRSQTFTIQESYWFTEDYKEEDASLCALDKAYFLKDYVGRDNETLFREYIQTKKNKIEWWFKNRDYGKEYFGIKYFDEDAKKYRLFYPDWIIRFKDGKIGIFDTKKGKTALPSETKNKAEALQTKLKELGNEYIGGIVVFENGVWNYNNSKNYDYAVGEMNNDWKPLETLF